MNLNIISATFTTLGEITIAYTVISVHHRVMKEHKIDNNVFKEMHREQKIALIGITLIVIGYVLNVITEYI
ncbi:MAG: hypothetical protein A2725_02415 [Candidatus Magasanikbacteria bacterium RIFCSPHIGHO2_01_FULL_33_34]|uniref:Uncharacterized protein n=1 Tax=Candidatus Magasanikbacteria bacterium RIFCSPHIGHO2_01_FULL_33_34 TaxID=1798671 RepID=A0A1F6LKF9_9BACT|nr:MAG: hypothetical protein A2725_02415 [Candidatus Magasanikbacteria bacterium RIFCSPHIGHO2_01_FULL_33_34]OGH65625.1 MAG: hypothetical protein A3B83_01985 [Candidatus Magasanikbacteria bacterium RIFCSPHIGHO2_02_FULL_33_17]OGH75834.1 MAG: hypothetical protein A3A89_02880 [Candidatus Magasanikbacteria bacterium RIFCSPLOWO2_01_FULL_33_34]OGH81154.1 MAG: hypothetical protein A3F93_01770 [Candidatus Magasanikbacteria bacterium RIFCSPLOWO2_12_FULL_34_7]